MTDPTLPVEPTAQVRKPLSREEYSAERKELYKYQQENWANFEKTLLTLEKTPEGRTLLAEVFAVDRFEPAPRMGYRALYRVAMASL